MAPVRIRTSVLILALFAGGYALAQPEATKGPRPAAAKTAPAAQSCSLRCGAGACRRIRP